MGVSKPKVTVLMPVYNGEQYLLEAVESVLNQSFGDFEFLIINDGSSDRTVSIVESIKDSRIRFEHNAKNIGLIETLNNGLDLAKGEYIARMDCDDICAQNRLEIQVEYLNKHLDVGICGTWIETIGAPGFNVWTPPGMHEEIKCEHLFHNSLYHPTVMMRGSVIKQNDLKYSTEFKHAEDFELWVRSSRITKLNNIAKNLLRHRIHENQIGRKHSNAQFHITWAVIRRQLYELGLMDADEYREAHFALAGRTTPEEMGMLSRVSDWVTKISDANRKTRLFSQEALQAVLFDKWYSVCFRAHKLGHRVWQEFTSCPIYKHCPLEFKRKLRIFIASFLRF